MAKAAEKRRRESASLMKAALMDEAKKAERRRKDSQSLLRALDRASLKKSLMVSTKDR